MTKQEILDTLALAHAELYGAVTLQRIEAAMQYIAEAMDALRESPDEPSDEH